MTRVVCVGDVMVDVQAQLPGPLAVGSDTPSPITVSVGGSAANTAAWLLAAGCSATLVARVGADAFGRQALDDLRAGGIDLEVSVDPNLPTGTCIVLVGPDGERTMIPSAGANAVGGDVPELRAGDQLHVSGYALFHPEARERALAALRTALSAGCAVSVDAASAAPLRGYGAQRFLADIAPSTSVLVFANFDEAAVFTGSHDPETSVRALAQRCGEAIVKCGGDGALWSDGTEVITVAAQRVPVIDSTGAGDAFAAGVLGARLGRRPVREALDAGARLAARAVQHHGGRP
jgi:ribokinase